MIGVSNVPNIWHLAHLRELMIVLLGLRYTCRLKSHELQNESGHPQPQKCRTCGNLQLVEHKINI